MKAMNVGQIIRDQIGNRYKVIERPKYCFGEGLLYKTIDQRGYLCIVNERGVYQDDMNENDFDNL